MTADEERGLFRASSVNATFNEPYEPARRLATLDHLSEGHAAWNVVTSSDAFTGENFRRGGYLDRADRYTRAAEFVATARELWDSWTPDGASRPFAHEGEQFTISGEFTVPRSPQGHPVVIQAGDSGEGGEFAASAADIIFTRHGTLEAGRAFYADVKARLAADGRGGADRLRRRAGGRRLHPRPASHSRRPGRLRRPGRPAPPGERRVPLRVLRLHAAVAPRPRGAGVERLTA